ncbi:response regulator receiver modulated diguanylate cyclase/phosphodiesterase [Paraglaciecola sp. T6c]|uniref:bifunctional diguanylate cyclase/phosphodiesterase n=1 Tax=Pseudoalteromonas atlantica (strain T6c / ATCC BAA-1087) TaxID=3042615 RepID=UPI00005C67D4|nr:EAL domain-containing protein [Paraglaciecola sp. T6c]ABG42534.1 response regulator receiver modulated diguanylate cyclase/phosphodiesterase [Paraglaciecola sp. T6c]
MCPMEYENDELIFLSEENTADNTEFAGSWNILVVDDDEEIHSVTRLALSDLVLNDRNLTFYHAYSKAEALEIIQSLGSTLAIILLDVVMETDDAGLQVAQTMRNELKLTEPRIILRTGQPGYAPEESVIKEYDINDYKTKTELTRSKLVTTIIASLRSYQQILTINQSRIGLEKIIHSAANLLEEHSVNRFCEGVVTQISSLIGLDSSGVVCARAGSVIDKDENAVYVLGAAGEFASYINKKIDNLHDEKIVQSVNQCLQKQHHIYGDNFTVLYLKSSEYDAAVFLKIGRQISEAYEQLIEVFLASISVGYENVNLFHQLHTAAFKDWLTKLPNRIEFINRLDDISNDAEHANDVVALIDINHFADINDGLGQDTGNDTLLALAQRIESTFPTAAALGRIGSDVFAVVGTEREVNPATLQGLFNNAFEAGDHMLPLSAAFGFCRFNGKKNTGINILKHANIALNRAKKSLKTNFEYYAPEMEEQTTWRLEMIRQLRTDFAERKLQLWYQPQIDLVTQDIIGMEALLRWPSSDGGFVSPAVFVPLAEYSGLIIDIGAWVMQESCEKLRLLTEAGFKGLRMAVNISMPQFRDPAFINLVKKAIINNDLEPDCIELEITESIVMDEPQLVVEALNELKEFGVKVALDDFGTGFSSMSYLQQLPLDRLKVDRAFVSEISPNKSAFIAETIVTLGTKLGLRTIAEGIEKPEQANYLLKLGCDEAQGFMYAKPMPFGELLTFIGQRKRGQSL